MRWLTKTGAEGQKVLDFVALSLYYDLLRLLSCR